MIVGNPAAGYSGIPAGEGTDGPGAIFFGKVDPAAVIAAGETQVDRPTFTNASLGSLYIRLGVGLYVKTGATTWQQVTVP